MTSGQSDAREQQHAAATHAAASASSASHSSSSHAAASRGAGDEVEQHASVGVVQQSPQLARAIHTLDSESRADHRRRTAQQHAAAAARPAGQQAGASAPHSPSIRPPPGLHAASSARAGVAPPAADVSVSRAEQARSSTPPSPSARPPPGLHAASSARAGAAPPATDESNVRTQHVTAEVDEHHLAEQTDHEPQLDEQEDMRADGFDSDHHAPDSPYATSDRARTDGSSREISALAATSAAHTQQAYAAFAALPRVADSSRELPDFDFVLLTTSSQLEPEDPMYSLLSRLFYADGAEGQLDRSSLLEIRRRYDLMLRVYDDNTRIARERSIRARQAEIRRPPMQRSLHQPMQLAGNVISHAHAPRSTAQPPPPPPRVDTYKGYTLGSVDASRAREPFPSQFIAPTRPSVQQRPFGAPLTHAPLESRIYAPSIGLAQQPHAPYTPYAPVEPTPIAATVSPPRMPEPTVLIPPTLTALAPEPEATYAERVRQCTLSHETPRPHTLQQFDRAYSTLAGRPGDWDSHVTAFSETDTATVDSMIARQRRYTIGERQYTATMQTHLTEIMTLYDRRMSLIVDTTVVANAIQLRSVFFGYYADATYLYESYGVHAVKPMRYAYAKCPVRGVFESHDDTTPSESSDHSGEAAAEHLGDHDTPEPITRARSTRDPDEAMHLDAHTDEYDLSDTMLAPEGTPSIHNSPLLDAHPTPARELEQESKQVPSTAYRLSAAHPPATLGRAVSSHLQPAATLADRGIFNSLPPPTTPLATTSGHKRTAAGVPRVVQIVTAADTSRVALTAARLARAAAARPPVAVAVVGPRVQHARGAPAPAELARRASANAALMQQLGIAQPQNTRHVRMMSVQPRTAASARPRLNMQIFVPNSTPTAREWLADLHMIFRMTSIADTEWLYYLGFFQSSPEMKRRIVELPPFAGETPREHYMRAAVMFEEYYTPRALEQRTMQRQLAQMRKTPQDNIRDYAEKYAIAVRLAYPGNEHGCEDGHIFNQFINSLDEDAITVSNMWNYEPRVNGSTSELTPSGVVIRSWDELVSSLNTYYSSRSRRDRCDSLSTFVQTQRAERAIAQRLGTTSQLVEPAYSGHYAHRDSKAPRNIMSDAFQQTRVTDAELRSIETSLTHDDAQRSSQTGQQQPIDRARRDYNTQQQLPPRGRDGQFIAADSRSQRMPAQQQQRGTRDFATKSRPARALQYTEPVAEDEPVFAVQAATRPSGKRPSSAVTGDAQTAPTKRFAPAARPQYAAPTAVFVASAERYTRPSYQPTLPVCHECAMQHATADCPRMPGSSRYREGYERYRGSGPNPNADPAAITRVKQENRGRVGADPPGSGRSAFFAHVHATRLDEPSASYNIRMPLILNGKLELNGLVDTGSHATLVSADWYAQWQQQLPALAAPPAFSITVANGDAARVEGSLALTVMVYDDSAAYARTFNFVFVVIAGLSCDCIIGMDLLKRVVSSISIQTGQVQYLDQPLPAPTVPLLATLDEWPADTTSSIVVRTLISIAPQTEAVMAVIYHAQAADSICPRYAEPIVVYDGDGELLDFTFLPHIVGPTSHAEDGIDARWLIVRNMSLRTICFQPGFIIGQTRDLTSREVAGLDTTPLVHRPVNHVTAGFEYEYDEEVGFYSHHVHVPGDPTAMHYIDDDPSDTPLHIPRNPRTPCAYISSDGGVSVQLNLPRDATVIATADEMLAREGLSDRQLADERMRDYPCVRHVYLPPDAPVVSHLQIVAAQQLGATCLPSDSAFIREYLAGPYGYAYTAAYIARQLHEASKRCFHVTITAAAGGNISLPARHERIPGDPTAAYYFTEAPLGTAHVIPRNPRTPYASIPSKGGVRMHLSLPRNAAVIAAADAMLAREGLSDRELVDERRRDYPGSLLVYAPADAPTVSHEQIVAAQRLGVLTGPGDSAFIREYLAGPYGYAITGIYVARQLYETSRPCRRATITLPAAAPLTPLRVSDMHPARAALLRRSLLRREARRLEIPEHRVEQHLGLAAITRDCTALPPHLHAQREQLRRFITHLAPSTGPYRSPRHRHASHSLRLSTQTGPWARRYRSLISTFVPPFSELPHRERGTAVRRVLLTTTPSAAAAATTPPAAAADSPASSSAQPSTPPVVNINPALSPAERGMFLDMIAQLPDAFARSTADAPPAADGVEHRIVLKDPTMAPIKQAAYRASPATSAAIDANVRKLIEQGLVRPSSSPWSSPVITVPKPDGSRRMCMDYRRLNAHTRTDAYPIPNISDLLHLCCSATWYTIVDIRDAFHHIKLAEAARPLTAFVTAAGLFEWMRMSFGLCNAPATFQRHIDNVLRAYIGKICVAFFDDCLIYTTGDLATHVEHVRTILACLARARLEAKLAKCRFAYAEMLFIGHIVGRGQVRPDPQKLRAIADFPTPTNLKQLRSFIGLASYYHKFIPGFAAICVPLYHLTRKDVAFEWSGLVQAAFVTLKDSMLRAPCLYAPDFTKPFILQTDASGDGIAAVLSQCINGDEHPIAFISRQLSKAEKNYSATEWECLAVVWAIGQFEIYLIDAPFTVVTDHSALQWLPTKKFENSRIMRWVTRLGSFSFTVLHRAGKANANADALSRVPVLDSAPSDAAYSLADPAYGPRDVTPRYVRSAVAHSLPFPVLAATASQPSQPRGMSYDVTTIIDIGDLTHFIAAQYDDPQLHALIAYVAHRDIPVSYDAVARRELVSRAASYVLLDSPGDLRPAVYYYPSRPRRGLSSLVPTLPRLLVPRSLRSAIIAMFHDPPLAGHYGARKTITRVATRYYWPTLAADVAIYVSCCVICQQEKVTRRPHDPPPGLMAQPTHPFELISMDFVGPLYSSEDFTYILTIIDHFSRWAICVPTQNFRSTTVTAALIDTVFTKFGMPSRILTDRGSSFHADQFISISEQLGVKNLFTSSFHPQSNGMIERFNSTLKDSLRAMAATYGATWVNYLQPVVFAYNTSRHDSTGHTPYYLLFGREAVSPGDAIAIAAASADRDSAVPLDAYSAYQREVLSSAHDFVHGLNTQRAHGNLADRMSHARTPVYAPGDLVWVRNDGAGLGNTISPGEAPHEPKYIGPFVIIARANDISYAVQLAGKPDSRHHTVNIRRLKPYYDRDLVVDTHYPSAASRAPAQPAQPVPGDLAEEDSSAQADPAPQPSAASLEPYTLPASRPVFPSARPALPPRHHPGRPARAPAAATHDHGLRHGARPFTYSDAEAFRFPTRDNEIRYGLPRRLAHTHVFLGRTGADIARPPADAPTPAP